MAEVLRDPHSCGAQGRRVAEGDEGERRQAQGGDRNSKSSETTLIPRAFDDPPRGPATLADLNITRDQSSKWQQLAEVPAVEFERAVLTNGRARPSD